MDIESTSENAKVSHTLTMFPVLDNFKCKLSNNIIYYGEGGQSDHSFPVRCDQTIFNILAT